MTYFEIILLALALSIDACVVSFSYGITFDNNRLRNSLQLAFFTGAFQGIMPFLGYYLTSYVKSYISPYAGIIVFLIFMYLGVKIIMEAFEDKSKRKLCLGLACLFMIGIATSIDAFSAGISLSLYGNKIIKPALLIAFVTFINSLFGFWVGCRLKNLSTKSMEIFAGLILIFLAVKSII